VSDELAKSYDLPPEWAMQSGIMLTWPHQASDWRPYLADVEPVFVHIAQAICRFEVLLISANDATHQLHIQTLLMFTLIPQERFRIYVVPSNDSWTRDHGPITLLSEQQALLLDFEFNGWGNKYNSQLDNQITRRLHQQNAFGNAQLCSIPFVLEGGSIDVDGNGTVLTTSRCLLDKHRNQVSDKATITEQLKAYLPIDRVLWLDHGYLEGDDTDSHIDTLARFVNPQTIVYVACHDPEDNHYPALQKMRHQLETFTNKQGQAYQLIPLPWPNPKYDDEQRRLPATYANFLIINDAVLVPQYEDPADEQALAILQSCFPEREIIGIPCIPLIQQNGSLHCLTMQLPEGVLSEMDKANS